MNRNSQSPSRTTVQARAWGNGYLGNVLSGQTRRYYQIVDRRGQSTGQQVALTYIWGYDEGYAKGREGALQSSDQVVQWSNVEALVKHLKGDEKLQYLAGALQGWQREGHARRQPPPAVQFR